MWFVQKIAWFIPLRLVRSVREKRSSNVFKPASACSRSGSVGLKPVEGFCHHSLPAKASPACSTKASNVSGQDGS